MLHQLHSLSRFAFVAVIGIRAGPSTRATSTRCQMSSIVYCLTHTEDLSLHLMRKENVHIHSLSNHILIFRRQAETHHSTLRPWCPMLDLYLSRSLLPRAIAHEKPLPLIDEDACALESPLVCLCRLVLEDRSACALILSIENNAVILNLDLGHTMRPDAFHEKLCANSRRAWLSINSTLVDGFSLCSIC